MSTYTPRQLLPPLPSRADPQPIPSALAIDPYSDVLWVGTSGGIVSSFCNPVNLLPNVRFPAPSGSSHTLLPHSSDAVREIHVQDREVRSLTEAGVGGRRRGGAAKWLVNDPMRGLRCMSSNPANSHEVLVGGTGSMMLVNTSRSEVVRKFDASTTVHLSPLAREVVIGSMGGSISILDPRTGFRATSTVQTHTGGLSGADANGHLICTWGWTHMQGRPLPDPLVRVYDVRKLRPLPPITFPSTPAFARLHPSDTSKLVIASQEGSFQVVDMQTPAAQWQYQQLDVKSYITSMAISPQADYIAFGDADGQVHIWGNGSDGPFNGYDGIKPDWPDAAEPTPSIKWEERTPLSAVGMPFYKEPLLSNFSEEDYAPVTSPFFNPPEPVAQVVLASMKMSGGMGYANLPAELKGKRLVRTARPGVGKRATGKARAGYRRESGPRFRSDKERDKRGFAFENEETPEGQVPKWCRKVEIKYSRFGIEDFDFGFYNRTQYSGLETDILNSYTNSLLQVLHYSAPIRAIGKAHLCVDCTKEHCLLCEAGFLFRMLEDAKGTNCQGSNFSRAFSATSQASALGLMDDEENHSTQPYGSLIQNFNRWLLSTLSSESIVNGETPNIRQPTMSSLSLENSPSAIDQVLGTRMRTANTCSACHATVTRETVMHVLDVQYPRKANASFCEVLQNSIVRDTDTKATCSSCKRFIKILSKRSLAGEQGEALPPVLSINANAATAEVESLWKTGYLPTRFVVSDQDGVTFAMEGSGMAYNLKSLVVQVKSDGPAHLVSYIRMPEGWFMFNDFLVRQVDEKEVLAFPEWKLPAVIVFEREDDSSLRTQSLPDQLNQSVLLKDVSLARNRRHNMIKHRVLSKDELPQAGTPIAIDAEFVALQQEELEFRSDGTKKTLRPSHMSLARVSVLRDDSVPFIDDYILTKETVVDYLTEYSGIKSGDLDVNNSPHTLVPLKVAYKKLRLLVDSGCIFIGHGLAKDFRTINIYVPPSQIIDTVNIYTLPSRQRKLSLRFLTWYVLKVDIQTAAHDSIEDAKYALLLYKEYLKYKEEGRFEDFMEEIFEEGQKMGFKPPHESRPSSPAILPGMTGPGGVLLTTPESTPRKGPHPLRTSNWRERVGSPTPSNQSRDSNAAPAPSQASSNGSGAGRSQHSRRSRRGGQHQQPTQA